MSALLSRRAFVGGALALATASACGDDRRSRDADHDTMKPVVKTIRYGDDPSHVLDLHLPETAGPHPVAVVIHGGFWGAAYERTLMTALAADLAARGIAAANIEYRRVGNGGGWPATFDDVASAVDHLGELAAPHELDLDRVVSIGHSAGGHLAVWTAARGVLPSGAPGASPRVAVRGAVSQAGLLDLVASEQRRLGGGAAAALLGGSPDDVPDRYALASPAALVPIGVPVVCVHGRDDEIVPPSQSEDYARVAGAAGDDATVELVDGDHFVVIDRTHAAWRACRGAVERLLD